MKECSLIDRAILFQPSKELPGETIIYVDVAKRTTIACWHDVERITIFHFLKVFNKLTEVDLSSGESEELITQLHKANNAGLRVPIIWGKRARKYYIIDASG